MLLSILIDLYSTGEVTLMDYKALGSRIRQQRKLMRMTQEELAAVSDVSTSYIGHIERGIKRCSLETLVCICNALDISPNALLRDSLNRVPSDREQDLSPEIRAMLNDITNVLREHNKKFDNL